MAKKSKAIAYCPFQIYIGPYNNSKDNFPNLQLPPRPSLKQAVFHVDKTKASLTTVEAYSCEYQGHTNSWALSAAYTSDVLQPQPSRRLEEEEEGHGINFLLLSSALTFSAASHIPYPVNLPPFSSLSFQMQGYLLGAISICAAIWIYMLN